MRNGSSAFLVDTNVLVYAYDPTELHGVPNVLSEDFSDGALLEGVRFLNPFATAFDLAVMLGETGQEG